MDDRAWVQLYPASDMKFAMRATSVRNWTGFYAAIYDTSGGRVCPPARCHHCVVMHVGVPINATCRLDDLTQRRVSMPGDLDIIPTECSASWEEDGATTMLSIRLTPSLVDAAAREMGLDPARVSIAPQLQLRDPAIEHIGLAIKAELETPEPLGRLYAESLGTALAARLLQRYAPVAPNQHRSGPSKRQLRNVIDFIHDNLTSDLKLAELAAIAGLSPSHFKSLFRRATGMPVHRYVIQCRIETAVNFLSHSKTSLSEVASFAGFSDQSHMARCMRRVLGVTPAQVRRHGQ